jgi:hypothetical protein
LLHITPVRIVISDAASLPAGSYSERQKQFGVHYIITICNYSAPRKNSINSIGKLAFQADLLSFYGADKRRSRSDRPT